MRESPICVESQAKKKKKKGTCLDVTPRKLISNLRLDSDGKESDNDKYSDPSDFDEDEIDVNNDAAFEESDDEDNDKNVDISEIISVILLSSNMHIHVL